MLRNVVTGNLCYLLQNSHSLVIKIEQLHGVENAIFWDVW